MQIKEPITVLLVEDNVGDARLVREMLREMNATQIKLLHVVNLEECQVCLAKQRNRSDQEKTTPCVGVILLDLSLPDGNGLETVMRVRSAAPDIPIVVMSGLTDEAIALKALQEGAQDYLVKGYTDGHGLIRAVSYAIERQRMQLRLQQTQQALQQQLEREALINRITTALNSNLDPQFVVQEIVRQTLEPMGGDFCMVARDLPESKQFLIEAEYWSDLSEGDQRRNFLAWQGKTLLFEGWQTVRDELLQNRPVTIQNEKIKIKNAEILNGESSVLNIPAVLMAPIFVRNQYYGNLVVGYIQGENSFSNSQIQLLQQLAQQTAIALYNARELEQLEHLVEERTQQLGREKALVEAILNSIQEGIVVSKPDGQVVMLNPAGLQIYGFVGEVEKPKPKTELAPHLAEYLAKLQIRNPDGSCPTLEELPISRTIRGEIFTNHELIVDCPNGEQKWVSLSGSAVVDEAGEVLLAVNTTRDITKGKQAEKALRESETKFRTLYESTSAAVMLLDEKGFFDCNSATLELLGCSDSEEFCGKHPSEFSPPTQPNGNDSFSLACDRIATALREGNCRFDWIHRRKDGTDFPTEVMLSAIELGNRKVIQAVVYDISDRIQTEIELRQAYDAAEAGSRAKSEFLATISHELRTPLNSILGLSNLLLQEIFGTLNQKQKEYAACIHTSGEHLLALINDILDLSKVEAGKEQLTLTPVNVENLCEYALTIMREQALERGLQLTCEIEPNVNICLADERRLKQMLLNLLSNAIKFTPAGSVNLIVQKQPEGIAFTVADTGIGIAPEKLPLLFQPFRQLDSGLNRQFTGTGLGLSLTRGLARLHGGDVRVSSTLGKGSTFTIDIPDLSSGSSSVINYQSSIINQESSSNGQKLKSNEQGKILIVEDDKNSGMLLNDYLKSIGYTVEILIDGANFISRVQTFKPHLILLDFNLPNGITGLDLLTQLRQEPDIAELPVVIVTAMAMADDKERCLNAGADDYLSKPVGVQQLELVLMRYF
ncbi:MULTISPECIES: response regulator [Cyanophyceae]|uniref:response regulator n=1 Tax=Cyanophyceae TaxID=3028117 RepID=UPI001688B929|nr:response regulator [Trichocoleus sp. FACHB-69]MBD1933926.1 response regulator [Trichocoleus sp. FACHB-69]